MEHLTSSSQDRCPAWAVSLITALKELEIKLGNLRPDSTWTEATLDQILERVDKDPEAVRFDENATQELFKRLCSGLTHEGYSPDMIAQFINSRLTPGQRLSYCNADEVRDTLSLP